MTRRLLAFLGGAVAALVVQGGLELSRVAATLDAQPPHVVAATAAVALIGFIVAVAAGLGGSD